MTKTHARNVHHEFCADSKRDWGKASIEWGVLSVDEKRLAISEVRSRLEGVFGAGVSDQAIEEGITQRLYHLRRDWLAERSRLAVQPGSASTPSEAAAPEAAVSEAAVTQNATKQKEARFFDPARELNKDDDP
jgi:hypothetical protein